MDVTSMISVILATIIGVFVLESIIFLIKDNKEPDYVRPQIPLVGHLIGIARYGSGRYYTKVATQQKAGLFTLPIFSFKTHVISERKYVGAIQRHAKTISFAPFAAKTSRSLSGIGDTATRIQDHLTGPPAAKEFDRTQRAALAAGSGLDDMSLVYAKTSLRSIEELACKDAEAHFDLYEWVRKVVTSSASEGVFGPKNPFHDPEHEADFWTFADQAHLVFSGPIVSNLLARSAVRAKERNRRRYEEYIRMGGHETASLLIKERCRLLTENGVPESELGRINVGLDIAMLANYIPTAFWAIFEVFSRSALVEAIREEVRSAVQTQDGPEGVEHVLDLSILKTQCPLLLSTIQETQRFHSVQALIREVLQDTTLTVDEAPRLLKKGGFVQVNGISILRDEQTWGPSAAEFDPYRFIKMKKTPGTSGVAASSELPPHSFIVWGVAPHVCPARWYATGGLMALVATMVLKFDVEAVGAMRENGTDGRNWRMPKTAGVISVLLSPDEPVPVVVRSRTEYNGRWNVRVGAKGSRLQLSVS